jgi:hypothetical protein
VCEIVQYVLEVDSMYLEYEPVLVWHATLCQTMDYPTVSTLALSLYDVVESMSFREDLEFEFAVNHFSRWMEAFESLEDIKTTFFRCFTGCVRVWKATVHCSDTLTDMDFLLVCLGHSRS